MCDHTTGPQERKEATDGKDAKARRAGQEGPAAPTKDRRLGEPREVSWEEIEALELDPRVELIRQLIPLGLAEYRWRESRQVVI